MYPIILHIEHLTIYSYGLMLSVGFLLSAWLAMRHGRREGVNPGIIMDVALWSIVCGIAGARILYVLFNFTYYAGRPLEIIMLNQGGLVYYGGLLTGAGGGVWYLKRKGLKVGPIADIVIPYVPLGQAFGRIGCFLNGCCYGKVASFGSGVVFPLDSIAGEVHPYQPLIPVQLYSALALIGVFLILKLFQNKKLFPGYILVLYGIFYSAARWTLEFFRGDNPAFLWGLTVSQTISLVVFLICGIILLWKFIISRHQPRGTRESV